MTAMLRFAMVLTGIVCAPFVTFADDEKPRAEAVEEKAEAKPEKKAPAADAQPLRNLVEALGNLFGGVVEAAVDAPAMVEVAIDAAEGGEVGGDPLEQQFKPQFRQLLKTELSFVRSVCRPNADQDKLLKPAGDAALKAALKKFAENQKKLQQGIRAGDQIDWPDPRKLMADVLLKTVKESMSAEQAQRYEAEIAKRATARKRAALLCLIAKLDRNLVLTADQRDKLTESLNANWKDAWCQQLEVFLYGEQYLPVLPDDNVVPILTEKQKVIWQAIPKSQNQIWGWVGFGFVQPVEIDEAVVVEQAVEAQAVEEKKEESP